MMRAAELDLATPLPSTPQDVAPEGIPAEAMPGMPEEWLGRPGGGPSHSSGDRLAEVLRALPGAWTSRIRIRPPASRPDAGRNDGARTRLAMLGLSFG